MSVTDNSSSIQHDRDAEWPRFPFTGKPRIDVDLEDPPVTPWNILSCFVHQK
jgi:hypothetical protein